MYSLIQNLVSIWLWFCFILCAITILSFSSYKANYTLCHCYCVDDMFAGLIFDGSNIVNSSYIWVYLSVVSNLNIVTLPSGIPSVKFYRLYSWIANSFCFSCSMLCHDQILLEINLLSWIQSQFAKFFWHVVQTWMNFWSLPFIRLLPSHALLLWISFVV